MLLAPGTLLRLTDAEVDLGQLLARRIVGAAVALHSRGAERMTLLGLPTTATSILLLLALRSYRARDDADRGRRRGASRRR